MSKNIIIKQNIDSSYEDIFPKTLKERIINNDGENAFVELNKTFSNIGDIKLTRNPNPGSNYLLCNGASIDPDSYKELSSILQNNTLPTISSVSSSSPCSYYIKALIQPELQISADIGNTITLTKDGAIYEGEENFGIWTYKLTDYGTYTATSQNASETFSQTINISETKLYRLALRNLPERYTALTYIKSSGNQYINTGITPIIPNTYEFEINVTPLNSVSDNVLFGHYNADANVPFCPYYWYQSGYYVDFQSSHITSGNNTVSIGVRHISTVGISTNNQYVKINGDLKASSAYTLTNYGSLPLYLFAKNRSGIAYTYASAKLYSLKIVTNGIITNYFVPCKNSSNEIGIFDTIRNQFYGNNGSGSFEGE